jgi:polysaccharide chain length determinant protein (PEP-CTERM system associated)
VLPGRKFSLEDFLRIALRRKWLILIPFVVVSVATVIVVRRLPDEYRSETTILVISQRVPESYVRSTVTDRIEDRLQSLKEQILSRSRLERIIEDLNLYPDRRSPSEMDALVVRMRAGIKVDDTVRGDAFTISYTSREPRTTQIVTERLASLFIEENVRDREKLADGTSAFLQVQLDDARDRLVEQEKKLEAYSLQYAGELPSQAGSNLQALQNGGMQLQALVDSINRDRDRQASLERQLADLLGSDVPGQALPAPQAFEGPQRGGQLPRAVSPAEELSQAQAQLQVMEGRLTNAHPDLRRVRRRIAQLERQIANQPAPTPGVAGPAAVRSPLDMQRDRRIRDFRAELDALNRRIAAAEQQQAKLIAESALYQSRLEAAPVRESELKELNRDYETMQQIYRTLLAKREDSKVAANLERRQVGEQFRVLDRARVPEQPFSPDRLKLNAIGIALGLLLGLGLAAALEFMDSTFKTEDDIRLVLALPVIATIPILESHASSGPGARLRVPWILTAAAAGLAAVIAVIAWSLHR